MRAASRDRSRSGPAPTSRGNPHADGACRESRKAGGSDLGAPRRVAAQVLRQSSDVLQGSTEQTHRMMETGLHRALRDSYSLRDVLDCQIGPEPQNHDYSMVGVERCERSAELIAAGRRFALVGDGRQARRIELLNSASGPLSKAVTTGVDEDPIHPGLELVGVTQPVAVAPRRCERVLRCVLSLMSVAQDRPGKSIRLVQVARSHKPECICGCVGQDDQLTWFHDARSPDPRLAHMQYDVGHRPFRSHPRIHSDGSAPAAGNAAGVWLGFAKSKPLREIPKRSFHAQEFGEPARIRTENQLIKSQLLYR